MPGHFSLFLMIARRCCLAGVLLVPLATPCAAQNGPRLGPALSQAMAGMAATQSALEALLRDPDAAAKAAADPAVRAALAALQGQMMSLQKVVERMQVAAPGGAAGDLLAACRAVNVKLLAVGHEILHLYETQSFQNLLARSYEPLLGLYRVKLENLMQDYDDKLLDSAIAAPATGTTP
jgi:hypothetical protein